MRIAYDRSQPPATLLVLQEADFCLLLPLVGGAGGNRTLVQTRKTQAFYMLIFDYIFVQRQNQSHQPMPYPLKLHLRREAGADYPRFGCTTWPECFGATASE